MDSQSFKENNITNNFELVKLQATIQNLEDELKHLLEKEGQRDKSELEMIIDNFDEILLSNRIKGKKITKIKIWINEEYLNKLLKESKEGFIRIDENNMVKDITSKVVKLLGYKKEELQKKDFKSICPWADRFSKSIIRIDHKTQHKYLFYDRKKFNLALLETPLLNKEKNEVPCQIKASSLIDSNKKFNGAIILLKDNRLKKNLEDKLSTEKKRLEEFIKKSPEIDLIKKLQDEHEASKLYLEQVIDAAADGIFVTDGAGFMKRVNKAFAKMLGYLPDELLGKHLADVYPIEEGEYDTTYGKKVMCERGVQMLEYIGPLYDKGEVHFEYHLQRKDGLLVPLDISLYWIYDKEGKRLDAVGILRDTTEKKKAEKALEKAYDESQQAKDYLENIFQSSTDGIVVFDLFDGSRKPTIRIVNNAFEKLSGYKAEEVIGESLDELIPPDNLMKEKSEGHEFDIEWPSYDSKHPRIIRVRPSVISGREGRQTGIVALLHDVTHEREVDRMKTEFISTAAHELRTPLTSSQGFSEIMLTRDDLSEDEKNRFLSYINKQSIGLTNIVSDLLDIARIESERGFKLNKVPCSISEIINQVVPYFQEHSKKHHFEVDLPEKPVTLHVDKQKMEQVFKNLISNAVKYSSGGGRIRVSGRETADAVEALVEDQGVGMTPEQVEKIFDKFYRADVSDKAVEGTGLGMTIVKYIVELHGGKIWVESKLGKGTTVKFTIPT